LLPPSWAACGYTTRTVLESPKPDAGLGFFLVDRDRAENRRSRPRIEARARLLPRMSLRRTASSHRMPDIGLVKVQWVIFTQVARSLEADHSSRPNLSISERSKVGNHDGPPGAVEAIRSTAVYGRPAGTKPLCTTLLRVARTIGGVESLKAIRSKCKQIQPWPLEYLNYYDQS
jgi:hypothetical protein